MKVAIAVLYVCSLALYGSAVSVLASYQEANCTQVEASGSLQDVLVNISLTEQPPTNTCVQVNISPGSYVISRVLNIFQNVALRGVGGDVTVAFNATKPAGYQAGDPFYVLLVRDTFFASLSNIRFASSTGIIAFENVTEVRITNCTFRSVLTQTGSL